MTQPPKICSWIASILFLAMFNLLGLSRNSGQYPFVQPFSLGLLYVRSRSGPGSYEGFNQQFLSAYVGKLQHLRE